MRQTEGPARDTFWRSQQLYTHVLCERGAVSDTLLSATPVSNDLLAHAKVYVFAGQIPDQCTGKSDLAASHRQN
jgi:hypothetical protein